MHPVCQTLYHNTSQLDTEVVANTLLPSMSDDLALINNITTIISRVLVGHLEYFKFAFEDTVNWHIKHKFYGEICLTNQFW